MLFARWRGPEVNSGVQATLSVSQFPGFLSISSSPTFLVSSPRGLSVAGSAGATVQGSK